RSRSATHPGLRLRQSGLELLGATAVDLCGRLLHRVRERRVDHVGLAAVVDRDDAGRAGWEGVTHLLSETALDLVLCEQADDPPGSAADDRRSQERGREQAHDQSDPAADLEALASEV